MFQIGLHEQFCPKMTLHSLKLIFREFSVVFLSTNDAPWYSQKMIFYFFEKKLCGFFVHKWRSTTSPKTKFWISSGFFVHKWRSTIYPVCGFFVHNLQIGVKYFYYWFKELTDSAFNSISKRTNWCWSIFLINPKNIRNES